MKSPCCNADCRPNVGMENDEERNQFVCLQCRQNFIIPKKEDNPLYGWALLILFYALFMFGGILYVHFFN